MSSNQLANAVSPFELDALGDESLGSIVSENGSCNSININTSTPGRTPELTPDSSPLPNNLKFNNSISGCPDSPSSTSSMTSSSTPSSRRPSNAYESNGASSKMDLKINFNNLKSEKGGKMSAVVKVKVLDGDFQEELEDQQGEESGDLTGGVSYPNSSSMEGEQLGLEKMESQPFRDLPIVRKGDTSSFGLGLLMNSSQDLPDLKIDTKGEIQMQSSPTSSNDQPFTSFLDAQSQDSSQQVSTSIVSPTPSRPYSPLLDLRRVNTLKESEKENGSLSASSSQSSVDVEILSEEFQDKFPSPPLRTPGSVKDLLFESPFFSSNNLGEYLSEKERGKGVRNPTAAGRSVASQIQSQDQAQVGTPFKSQLLPSVTLNTPSRKLEAPSGGGIQLGNMHVTSPLAKRRMVAREMGFDRREVSLTIGIWNVRIFR